MAKFRFTSAIGLKLAAGAEGLAVSTVASGSDAETKGIGPGDIVLGTIDGAVLTTPRQFETLVKQNFDAGRSTMLLRVEDSSGASRFVAVPISEPEPEKLRGTAANDVLDGTAYADSIMGLGGKDMLSGGKGDDVLKGGRGDDRLEAGGDDDVLHGNGGNDRLIGG